MSNVTIREMWLNGLLGHKVFRAAAADPQNAWTSIFTITGGLVLITALIGVRTVAQAGGASTMQFRHSIGPTVGCVATAITADAIGTVYTITGNVNDNIVIGAAGAPIQGGAMGSQTVASVQMFGSIASAGNIQYICTAVAGTGSTRFILTYVKLDPGASVAPA